MPRVKKVKEVETKVVEKVPKTVALKEVLCGHEEVLAVVRQEDKIWKCGEHGEHKLSKCQELCV